jgi:oxygen-dependent protoporphyrinogen oxidase
MTRRVTILGAGFSGLTLAHYLLEQGVKVELHERSGRCGGLLASPRCQHGFYETAANALMGSRRAKALFDSLGLERLEPLKASRNRFIWRGRPRRWPLGFGESLNLVSRLLLRMALDRKGFRPRPGETLAEWGQRNLTPAAQHYLLETVLQGIYGAQVADLSASLVLGRFFVKGRERVRGQIAPREGMQGLMSALEKSLKLRGAAFHFHSEGPSLPLDGGGGSPAVLCLKASEAAERLAQDDPGTSALLRQVRMHDKTAVTVFYDSFPRSSRRYNGFGTLVPPGREFELPLGVLMNSFIFAGRDQSYNENWIYSAQGQQRLLALDEAGQREMVLKAREEIFGERLPIAEIKLTHWAPALPIYDLALERVLGQLDPKPGIRLHGNWLGLLGLAGILDRSAQMAQELAHA